MDEYISYLLAIMFQKKYKQALELGCAGGRLTAQMAQVTNVEGADICPTYIKKCKKAMPELKFFVADARKRLPKKYDLIVTHGLLLHVSDKDIKKTIKNIMRHCKEAIFIESSAPLFQAMPFKEKYNPKIYWENRAKHPGKEDKCQYCYSHDFPKLFDELKIKYQIIKEFDVYTKTRMYLCKGR